MRGLVLLDLGLCAKAVDDESPQVVRVIGRVGNHMADAGQAFDQSAGLGAIAPMAGRDREPDRQAERIDRGMEVLIAGLRRQHLVLQSTDTLESIALKGRAQARRQAAALIFDSLGNGVRETLHALLINDPSLG